jgi:hypothetical protein
MVAIMTPLNPSRLSMVTTVGGDRMHSRTLSGAFWMRLDQFVGNPDMWPMLRAM